MKCIKIAAEIELPRQVAEKIENSSAAEVAYNAAYKYFYNGADMAAAVEALKRFPCADTNDYEKYLLFVLNCAVFLKEDYNNLGISSEVYRQSVLDIKYKLFECKKVYDVFGITDPIWFDPMFKLNRFGIGRLQYERMIYNFDDFARFGYKVSKGDRIYRCYIPSSGPLTQESVKESLCAAYDFFKSELKGDVIPVICRSWLLFPDNAKFLPETSNTMKFAKLFSPIKAIYTDGFLNSWRVFGKDYSGNTSDLPAETSMQKNILSWLNAGGTIGEGIGILLFDGENIL